MTIVCALIAGTGMACLLYRRTALGVLIGIQLLMLAATLLFVVSGSSQPTPLGDVSGLFITISALVQLAGGFALVVRLFYLKRKTGVEELRSLKH